MQPSTEIVDFCKTETLVEERPTQNVWFSQPPYDQARHSRQFGEPVFPSLPAGESASAPQKAGLCREG